MIEAKVNYETRDAVAWVTLNRPEKLNALAGDMREQFLEHVKTAARDDQIRSIVVTGEGGAFVRGVTSTTW
jgi:2-(1,2-epoxy-1,2-dihydrophenyl)acetyl-CoA isomerase